MGAKNYKTNNVKECKMIYTKLWCEQWYMSLQLLKDNNSMYYLSVVLTLKCTRTQ